VTFYSHVESPVGRLLMTSDGTALTGLYFHGGPDTPRRDNGWVADDGAPPFQLVRDQLDEYWRGARRAFDLPTRPAGTPFQQRVWQAIAEVPFGTTISYRDLAVRAGSSRGSRAAGLATGRNPISIIIPCHRIVGSNGSLTGYGGGLDRKRLLLELEGVLLPAAAVSGWPSSRIASRS
jgi:methylated-DNA-[protein]-cysteine S-methyltransferase